MEKLVLVALLLSLAASFFLLGCTETVPGVPFSVSQFVNKTTDLNYSLFVSGYYDGNFLAIDGNKLSVVDINAVDLNIPWSSLVSFPAGCGVNQAVKIVGSSLVCVDLPVDTNWQTSWVVFDANMKAIYPVKADVNAWGDARYVNVTGDSMTGGLNITKTGGIVPGANSLYVAGISDASPSGEVLNLFSFLTSVGSHAFRSIAIEGFLNDGYTGSKDTIGVLGTNNQEGGTGTNYAISGSTINGGDNTGHFIGVGGIANNAGTGTSAGGSFTYGPTVVPPTSKTGLFTSNGTTTANIFVAADNNREVFVIGDDGNITKIGKIVTDLNILLNVNADSNVKANCFVLSDGNYFCTKAALQAWSPTPDLTGYALLNGSNQPFTGDLNVYKSSPRITVKNSDTNRANVQFIDGYGYLMTQDSSYFTPMGVWTKYNNVAPTESDTTGTDGRIPDGTAGKGDSSAIYMVDVLKVGSTFYAYYTGYDGSKYRVYRATSSDGLTWTKTDNTVPSDSNTTGTNGRLPIGEAGSGDVTRIDDVSVLYDSGTWKMWYVGVSGTVGRIYYATSADGLTWTKYDNSIPSASDTTSTNGRVGIGTAGKSDATSIYSVDVIKIDGAYKMWYSSSLGDILHATSPDGLTWTKYDNTIPTASNTTGTNGRVPRGTSSAYGDFGWCHFMDVIYDAGTYRMQYTGHKGSNEVTIFGATSIDGLTWNKINNVLASNSNTTSTDWRVPRGTSGKGDATYAQSPTWLVDNDYFKMWYDGYGSGDVFYATMAYATFPTTVDVIKLDISDQPYFKSRQWFSNSEAETVINGRSIRFNVMDELSTYFDWEQDVGLRMGVGGEPVTGNGEVGGIFTIHSPYVGVEAYNTVFSLVTASTEGGGVIEVYGGREADDPRIGQVNIRYKDGNASNPNSEMLFEVQGNGSLVPVLTLDGQTGNATFDNNVYATDFVELSHVADFNKSIIDTYFANVNNWKDSRGKINYLQHPAGVSFEKQVVDYNKPVYKDVNKEVCDKDMNSCDIVTEKVTTYPFKKTETDYGLSYGIRVSEMEKMIYELWSSIKSILDRITGAETKITDLEKENSVIKTELCKKDKTYSFCK